MRLQEDLKTICEQLDQHFDLLTIKELSLTYRPEVNKFGDGYTHIPEFKVVFKENVK